MVDWNGNGRIDPIDIGISVAAQSPNEKYEEETELEGIRTTRKDSYTKNLWNSILRIVKRDMEN